MTDPNLPAIAGRHRHIPPILLQRARELRQQQTPAEVILWECLRARQFYGYKFRRQHNIGRFIADFYCIEAQLVIEVDGPIHDSQREKDAARDTWMESVGLRVLRVTNLQVQEDLEEVLVMILERL
ncbi:endonuclease domain-containing protein [Leptothoe sp. PORK10 BA2]|uniref:endonuclease domain-containing protein n=1 Tax=Leptothoe sp. PORK10 BA2 TaxID=3110254 RepID=UPI002B1F1191|nr:endonuclease domain-containing protein [Leptothoe sp. PORK10 BA2]MEA5463320.1 endonuclease domain-containing protein [Leptothoe sp. PORK10 BA2]